MKNWPSIALASLATSAVLGTAVQCGQPAHLPDELRRTVAMAPPRSINDNVKKASRLMIKRATDSASAKIAAAPKKTTIEELLKAVRPDDLAPDISTEAYQTKRIGPLETTNWQLDATVSEVIKRPDGDFYLVIEDGKGNKSVVEVPDPKLCAGSHKLAEITAARKAVEDKFHPNEQPQKVNIKARITGLGFFGYARAKDGKKPGNGARIMPGLKVEWL
jgi:hypothetical protein